jgi:hypothetical protein
MNLFQPHEIRYAQKNTTSHRQCKDFLFDKGRRPSAFRTGASKVYFAKSYPEAFPESVLISPDQHTVNKQLIWEYHSLS